MFSDIGLHAYFDRLGIPDKGRRLVEEARRNSPVRKVQSRLSNVITLIPSRKMKRMIATESRTVEYRAALLFEHDKNVEEYYSQPCYLDLRLVGKDGKTHGRIQYPPDFLVLTQDNIVVYEVREEERLVRLAKDFPHRFMKDNGTWRFPEVEAHLREMGITFRLMSSSEFPVRFLANTEFLEPYLRSDTPPLGEEAERALRARLEERPEWPLQWLVDEALTVRGDVTPPFKVDDIYKAVADGLLAFDLERDDLSATRRVHVFRDRGTLELHRLLERPPNYCTMRTPMEVNLRDGAVVDYDGHNYKVILTNPQKAILQDCENEKNQPEVNLDLLLSGFHEGRLRIISPPVEDGPPLGERLASYSPKAIDQALKRARILQDAAIDGKSSEVSPRTLQRYRKALREAGPNILDQHLALIPNHGAKGYRNPRIPQPVLDLIEKVLAEFNTPTGISPKFAFIKLRKACDDAGVDICSERALQRLLKKRASVRLRQGNRMAYQEGKAIWYLKADEPIHGVRPFQIVHIDHTEVELEILDPETGKSLWRVWLSLAIDAESRRMVGFYLSFNPPSYRSCMMILRDIVRRFGRLPDMIVVDNGKEFHSKDFTRFCLLFGIKLRYRPAAKARFGAVIERLFGTTQSQLIHQMEGNTKLMRHVRSVTKSVMPRNFVAWTFAALFGALDYYFEHLYGVLPHPAHGEGPVEHFNRRLAETGERTIKLVRYDEFFRIETCPSPKDKETRVVDGQRGVKVSHIWFWHESLRDHDGEDLAVRMDPWDPGVAYALIGGRWTQCVSKYKYLLGDLTEEELRHHLEILGERHGISPKDWSPELIAEWIKVLDPTTFDHRLTRQQAEERLVYEPLGLTRVASLGVLRPATLPPADTTEEFPIPTLGCSARDMETAEPTPISENDKSATEMEDGYEIYELM